MADFSSLKPKMEPEESMESVEPISPVSEALRIVEGITGTSSKFLMNKHQCEGLANRSYAIGEKLKELPREFVGTQSSDAGNKMDYPAFDVLLIVLRKAKALLSKYRESKASIPSVLIRTENREAFIEMHAELDIMNSQFHFEDFEHTSESKRSVTLRGDANEDLKKMSQSLHELAHSDESRQAAESAVLPKNLEKVEMVISEKSKGTSDDLPSYLKIDPAIVEIKDPIRNTERLSEHDPVETDGWALVRFGSWLGCKCALKVFKSGDITWNKNELLKEVRSLMELHHPHIVQLMGFAQDEEQCIILMELMDTDLRDYMKQRSGNGRRPFTRAQEMDIITQIAKGMYYLHEQQYVHGELKCSNILVKHIGDHIDVKISDLRSSQKLGVWDPVLFKERRKRRRPRWTAPEDKSYAEVEPTHALLKKTDSYSFGMVCFEVMTGKLPFQDIRDDALKTRIETGDLKQELPGELDDRLRGLIKSCWERDPNHRPTFEEICHLLDFIRSSQPPVTKKFSGIDTVKQGLFKLITPMLWFGGTEEKNDPPASSTWGHTNGVQPQDSAQVGANAVTLPDFVKIDPANLKKGPLIGEGGYAKVFEATWLGCRFAVKMFNVSFPIAVQKELKFLIELRHPSIVRLMGLAVHSERRWSIVMEYMGCSLRQLIDSRKTVPEPVHFVPFNLHEAVYIITKIALGMAFLHSRGVVHRDLKAANVLVPEHSGSIDVKITDFGVSELIDSSDNPSLSVGTSFWRAPEMFGLQPAERSVDKEHESKSHDLKAADVYSFAMICYEVLTGEVPLDDQINEGGRAGREAVIKGLRPTLPIDLNSDLKLLIEECWEGEPEKRPTFSSICTRLQKIQQGLQSSISKRVLSCTGLDLVNVYFSYLHTHAVLGIQFFLLSKISQSITRLIFFCIKLLNILLYQIIEHLQCNFKFVSGKAVLEKMNPLQLQLILVFFCFLSPSALAVYAPRCYQNA